MPYTYNSHSVYWLGEEDSGFPEQENIQVYEKIRDECKAKGELWEDPLFEAGVSSVCFSESGGCRPQNRIDSWKRPKDLVINGDTPSLFVKGISSHDVQQGSLGDCWLAASMSSLAILPSTLFHMVVPEDQNFEDDYAGVFHFRFWQYGCWVDVVVDDRLPTYFYQLYFASSDQKNEFWSALLEKAYAKLHGSYEALESGNPGEAFEDFTGGISHQYNFNKKSLPFKLLYKAREIHHWPMACATKSKADGSKLQGLSNNHAYTVIRVQYVQTNSGATVKLMCLRNPWGKRSPKEWEGAWSDGSNEWENVLESEKKRIRFANEKDSVFWMCYDDVKKYFGSIKICSLETSCPAPDTLSTCKDRQWHMEVEKGAWVRWATAGGNDYYDTYTNNPQFRIRVKEADDSDEIEDEEGKYSVLISLMQNHRRTQRMLSRNFLKIGFTIYKLEKPEKLPKRLNEFSKMEKVISSDYKKMRAVSVRVSLVPGEYCIVPSTLYPYQGCEFLLRVFFENPITIKKSPDHESLKSMVTDEWVKELFTQFAGKDKEVDWRVLKRILDHTMENDTNTKEWFSKTLPEGFSMDVCRSLVAVHDINHTGRLSYDEFRVLCIDILHWKDIFVAFCNTTHGYLSQSEVTKALNSINFDVKSQIPHVSRMLVYRHSSENGLMTLDVFIMSAIKFMKMIEYFNNKYPKEGDVAEIKKEEWLQMTIYS